MNLKDRFLVLRPGFVPDFSIDAPYRPAISIIAEVQEKIGSSQIDVLPIEHHIGLWLDRNRWKSEHPQLNLWATAILGVHSRTHTPDVLINNVVVTGLSERHLPRVLTDEQSDIINKAFKLDPVLLLASVRKQLIKQFGSKATAILTTYPDPRRTLSPRPLGIESSVAIPTVQPVEAYAPQRSPWAPPID